MTRKAGSPRSARWTAGAVTVAVLASLIALGITRIDLAAVAHALAGASAGWLVLAWALVGCSAMARAEAWFAAIRSALPNQGIGRLVVARVFLVGNAGSTVAPGRAGEAVRAWLIARRVRGTGALATVVGTLVSLTLLNVLALVILTVVVLLASAIPGARTGAIVIAAALPAVLVMVLLAGPRALGAVERWRFGLLVRVAVWTREQLEQIRRGLTVFRRPGTAVHAASFQLAAWGMQWGAFCSVLLAFDLERHAVLAAAAVLIAVNLTAILPLTPSNVGVFQATCIAVLSPLGVAASRGLAYGLVLQAVEVASGLVLGIPAVLYEGISLGDLRQAGTSRPAPANTALGSGGQLQNRGAGG